MLAKGFLDLYFDAAPQLEHFFQVFELSTKAACAEAAFNTIRKKSRTEGRDKFQGSVDPRFPAGLPLLAPQTVECKALRDSGKISRMFHGIFPQ